MKKVFIDGSAGTTGLRIYERLKAREDIELIQLPEEKRKDDAARKEAMDRSDITFLCLPDEAAKAAARHGGGGHGGDRRLQRPPGTPRLCVWLSRIVSRPSAAH